MWPGNAHFWSQSGDSFNAVPKLFHRVALQKKIILRYKIPLTGFRTTRPKSKPDMRLRLNRKLILGQRSTSKNTWTRWALNLGPWYDHVMRMGIGLHLAAAGALLLNFSIFLSSEVVRHHHRVVANPVNSVALFSDFLYFCKTEFKWKGYLRRSIIMAIERSIIMAIEIRHSRFPEFFLSCSISTWNGSRWEGPG